ncbi:MAG: glycosyltransferase family 2 protein [Acidobacteriaceae bacterium]
MVSIAITATARNLDSTLRDWCSYHLSAVDRIYLWLDDPREASSPVIPSDDRIRVRVGAQCTANSRHGDLMFRQNENTNRALHSCCKRGIDWLIHLDTDELLSTPTRKILHRNLPTGFGNITIPNHEVCSQWAATNPFRQCHYFKLSGKVPFDLYGNGKSAVRCHPGVHALDPHLFAGYQGESGEATSLTVLHYACATYDRWLRKYATLGDFSDFWWDDPAYPIELSFHLKSRDIYKQCLREGSFAPAKGFWKRHIFSSNQLNVLVQERKVAWYDPLSKPRR